MSLCFQSLFAKPGAYRKGLRGGTRSFAAAQDDTRNAQEDSGDRFVSPGLGTDGGIC